MSAKNRLRLLEANQRRQAPRPYIWIAPGQTAEEARIAAGALDDGQNEFFTWRETQ